MNDAEREIIGSVLINNSVMSQMIEAGLTPDMFLNVDYKETYKIMLSLYDKGEAITPVTMAASLNDSEGWGNLFRDVLSQTSTSFYAKEDCKVVMASWRSRMAKRLFENADFSTSSIDGTIGNLITSLEELRNNSESPVHSIKKIVDDNSGNYFNPNREQGIRFGFKLLDECLGGLDTGNVTVIAARPKVGKSAFATQIIAQLSAYGKVGYFNLEMGESEVYERMISRYSGIDLRRIRRALEFTGNERERFQKANEDVSKLAIDVISGAQTISRIKALAKHQGYACIVIDYMQLVKSEKDYGNRTAEVGQISADIKRLAMELKTRVIALAQLNRTHNEFKEPMLEDLRESGAIEQDASNVIFLWRPGKDPESRGVKVAKNRQGEEAKYAYSFDGAHMEFKEIGIMEDRAEGGDDFEYTVNPF